VLSNHLTDFSFLAKLCAILREPYFPLVETSGDFEKEISELLVVALARNMHFSLRGRLAVSIRQGEASQGNFIKKSDLLYMVMGG
jgi:hypothetical protein